MLLNSGSEEKFLQPVFTTVKRVFCLDRENSISNILFSLSKQHTLLTVVNTGINSKQNNIVQNIQYLQ